MSYTIVLTNGTNLTTVNDSSVDNTTSLTLVGRNYAGYGTAINTNFIKLLENSSSANAPSKPLVGQLWWDSTNRHLNIWQGSSWKIISSSLIGSTAPGVPVVGDFWWNTGVSQLSVYNGSQWVLVGPTAPPGAPITSTLADNVSDGVTTHTVGNLIVNNKLVAVYSTENSPFNPTSSLGGLTTIYPGLNIVNGYSLTTPAVTTGTLAVSSGSTLGSTTATSLSTNTIVAATSANLNVVQANSVSTTALTATGPTTFANVTMSNLSVSGTASVGELTASSLSVSETTSVFAALSVTGTLNAGTLQQGGNQVLHAANYNSYAPTLTGTGASGTWGISVTGSANSVYSASTGDYRQGHTDAAANSIAQRDSGGNLTANYFYGIATQAEYADLAERFASDLEYPVGTVMELGGTAEVTKVTDALSENIIGVISTNPAYLMNGEAGSNETHPAIALAGRVPVRVIGAINKNDRLVSAGNGLARSGSKSEITPFNVIGRALESKTDSGEGVIEAIVRVSI